MAREANLGDAQLVLASLSTSSRTDVSGCSSRESLSINPRKTNLSLLFLNSLVLSQVQFCYHACSPPWAICFGNI